MVQSRKQFCFPGNMSFLFDLLMILIIVITIVINITITITIIVIVIIILIIFHLQIFFQLALCQGRENQTTDPPGI